MKPQSMRSCCEGADSKHCRLSHKLPAAAAAAVQKLWTAANQQMQQMHLHFVLQPSQDVAWRCCAARFRSLLQLGQQKL